MTQAMLQSDQSAVRRGGKMSEKPILFSGAMVRAILEGRKSQTRRVVKNARGANSLYAGEHDGLWVVERFGDAASTMIKCPYGKPGDHLWVREMWKPRGVGQGCATTPAIYAAEYTFPNVVKAMRPWKPSIFMPRWASRITLEIVEVRVQRLQDISEEDARAEGVGPLRADGRMPYGVFASDGFADLWDSINMKRGFGWNVNPFVWAITFKRVTP